MHFEEVTAQRDGRFPKRALHHRRDWMIRIDPFCPLNPPPRRRQTLRNHLKSQIIFQRRSSLLVVLEKVVVAECRPSWHLEVEHVLNRYPDQFLAVIHPPFQPEGLLIGWHSNDDRNGTKKRNRRWITTEPLLRGHQVILNRRHQFISLFSFKTIRCQSTVFSLSICTVPTQLIHHLLSIHLVEEVM